MNKSRIKKIVVVAGFIILFLIGLIGYAYYELINTPIDIGIDEIGKQYTIVINNDEINDYKRLDNDDFELLKDKEVEKLRNYMKDNNLKIESGKYIVNQIFEYDDFIEVFKFNEWS